MQYLKKSFSVPVKMSEETYNRIFKKPEKKPVKKNNNIEFKKEPNNNTDEV